MIRKATIQDAKIIHKLVNEYAKQDEMLPRSLSEIYENIRDYFVYEEKKKIYGCGALHVVWEDIAEVKSLAVAKAKHKKGIGSKILKACLKEAVALKLPKVFVLTYKPGFFMKLGFSLIDKSELPHKIWGECIKCPEFPNCDESALTIQI
jgi:amino-acid N-acetyltransferase